MSGTKVYAVQDLKQHSTEKSCWLAIHGKVYDVTEFLEEHPGGFDIMLTATGKDATSAFDEIGHSKSAHRLLEKYLIGDFEGGDKTAAVPEPAAPVREAKQQRGTASFAFNVAAPLLILAVALALHFYFQSRPQA